MTTLEIRAGTQLPGGTYTLGRERHAKLLTALGSEPPPDGSAHPLAAWVIALGGCGVGIGELFEAAGVPMEDGPMLGSCALELKRPIGIDAVYGIAGTIEDITRKEGRKLGRFDVLRIRLEVTDPDGTQVATCTPSMILPRR